ncbi:MAG: ABC transporter permease [Desulfobacterales bacterium]|nr:MAG: ABC transporter permease [Desulfobacterales bacterium]
MDLSLIIENIGIYIEGLKHTVVLVSVSLFIGLLLAIPLAVLRTSKNYFIQAPIRAYVYFFRGTPLLVQMFIVYYGFGQFEAIKASFLWPFFKEAYFCALFAFTLNTGAYTTEIIRGAIEATPHGEIEAAKATGMSRMLMLRRIILPSAFRRALPTYSNEIIFMLHGSSLASVITIIDITGAARIINSRFYSPYEAFLTAAVFYMALTFLIVFLVKKLEVRWYAHLRPQETATVEARV